MATTYLYLAVADVHGHLALFEKLLAEADKALGADYLLVTLGDYVDNGPEIPALLDRLIALRTERGDRFVPIMGNHDLACARTLGWQGASPDEAWWSQWRVNFGGSSTCAAYGARSAKDLAARMPKDHQAFLQGLPWFLKAEEFLFVHAGLLKNVPIAAQLDELTRKKLPEIAEYTNPQLRDKRLATVSTAEWGKVVVSGHTKNPARRAERHSNAPHFADRWRITLDSGVDEGGPLHAVVLPERKVLAVDSRGQVREAGALK
jgi:hypothetical protein